MTQNFQQKILVMNNLDILTYVERQYSSASNGGKFV